MTGIFITSTGTGIGKTHLLAQLLAYDKTQHSILTVSKPIITGWPLDVREREQTDTGILLRAQHKACSQAHIEMTSPWRFRDPLSPDMAAKREGKRMDVNALVAYCHQKMREAKEEQKLHLIEGVGGVMVPLYERFTVLDWLEQLACPCMLVVGSYLGTLSHTLTAIRVLEMKNIPIEAIVVNETPESTVPFEETVENIARLLAPYPFYAYPYHRESPYHTQEKSVIASLYAQISSKIAPFLDNDINSDV
jgi:dethiobiotin synthetase